MMQVKADSVDVVLDETPILRDVSVEVRAGEVVGVVGPNGSGKSTFLRTVYRTVKPAGGAVYLDADQVWRLSARQCAQRVAAVAQESSADFDFTVQEIVNMGRTPHKGLLERESTDDATIVSAALARVGLADQAERLYATLSGGEKQLTLLARALAQQGHLLVLDEPTNHLDIHAQLELLEMVRELGVTTLLAVHDLNLAASYCDRLYVMSAGRVVTSGPVADVLTPALIEQVFGVSAFCETHPHTGRWHLVFAPRRNAREPLPEAAEML